MKIIFKISIIFLLEICHLGYCENSYSYINPTTPCSINVKEKNDDIEFFKTHNIYFSMLDFFNSLEKFFATSKNPFDDYLLFSIELTYDSHYKISDDENKKVITEIETEYGKLYDDFILVKLISKKNNKQFIYLYFAREDFRLLSSHNVLLTENSRIPIDLKSNAEIFSKMRPIISDLKERAPLRFSEITTQQMGQRLASTLELKEKIKTQKDKISLLEEKIINSISTEEKINLEKELSVEKLILDALIKSQSYKQNILDKRKHWGNINNIGGVFFINDRESKVIFELLTIEFEDYKSVRIEHKKMGRNAIMSLHDYNFIYNISTGEFIKSKYDFYK